MLFFRRLEAADLPVTAIASPTFETGSSRSIASETGIETVNFTSK